MPPSASVDALLARLTRRLRPSRLGMVAVAEGVESPAQYRAPAEFGCDAIQGWLFARAASARDIAPAIDRLADPPPWAGPHVVEPLPAESEPRRRRVRRS